MGFRRERNQTSFVYYMHVGSNITSDESDEHIVGRVQAGDSDAFGILIERYESKLHRYASRFIARTDDVDDILQTVFISAYQNIQGFDPSLRFSPWIYRIAHNACLNALRSSGRIAYSYDFDALVGGYVYEDPRERERELRDIRAQLDVGLEKLEAKYREILILHYYDDMPYKDISDILQIPIGTVGVRLKRAKEALKKHIHPSL